MKRAIYLPSAHDAPSRRQVIQGAILTFGSLAALPATALGAQNEEISHSEDAIHQETTYKSNRKRIYDALLDTGQFDKITNQSPEMKANKSLGDKPTSISRETGGTFTIFGGHIIGRNLELVPNERIVQAWRVIDWDAGHYSIVKFEFVEQGSGTRIVFDHTGFPKGQAEHLATGWKLHYWEPLAELLG
jgi:activator of HSP90 ATPase